MNWMAMNWVDWLFAAVLFYGAAMGAVKGLSHELATLIGMVVAVVATWMFYENASVWICDRWNFDPEITRLLAVVALVALSLFGMRMVRLALGTLMTFSFKGPVERVGGLLAGFLRRGAIYLVLMLVVYFLPWAWLQREIQSSQTGPAVLPHLVEGYNALAEKAALIQAEVPVGVELPHAVLPPPADAGGAAAFPWPGE